jgi:hypothetical protein
MKLHIDISIFIRSGGSFGHVSGTLELDTLPAVGDTLSFAVPRDPTVLKPQAFLGLLRIEDRVFDVANPSAITLMLEDLYFDSAEIAREAGNYLEKAFGLAVHVH